MKYYLILCIALSGNIIAHAGDRDSTVYYFLSDSIRAISFLADVKLQSFDPKKGIATGIRTNMVSLMLESKKYKKQIVFGFPKSAKIMSYGSGIDMDERGELQWDYNWNANEN